MEALLEYFPAKRIAMEEIPDATKEPGLGILTCLKTLDRTCFLFLGPCPVYLSKKGIFFGPVLCT